MKGRWRISVVLLMFLLFCGCSAKSGEQAADNQLDSGYGMDEGEETEAYTEAAVDSVAAETGVKACESFKIETEASLEVVSLSSDHRFEEYLDDTGKISLVDVNYQSISLREGNEALRKSIDDWMENREQELEKEVQELQAEAQEKLDQKGSGEFHLCNVWHEIEISRADSRVVSLVEREYTYGVDDWDTDYTCVNFDAESGEQISVNDILVDKQEIYEIAAQYCLDDFSATYKNSYFDEGFKEEVYEMVDEDGKWYLDATGIVLIYEDDDLDYSNEGVLKAHIPYEELVGYIKPEYVWENTIGVAALSPNQSASLTVNGKNKKITVSSQRDEYYNQNVQISYGEYVEAAGQYSNIDEIYLIKSDAGTYLMLDVNLKSDDYRTCLYVLDGETIVLKDTLDASIDPSNIGSDYFRLEFSIDVLGTYRTSKEYYIDAENKTLVTDDTEFQVSSYSYLYKKLVTTRELTVEQDGQDIILPAGSKIRILATDNQSEIRILMLDSGEEGILYFERGKGESKFGIYLNGEDQYDCFESIPYAG